MTTTPGKRDTSGVSPERAAEIATKAVSADDANALLQANVVDRLDDIA